MTAPTSKKVSEKSVKKAAVKIARRSKATSDKAEAAADKAEAAADKAEAVADKGRGQTSKKRDRHAAATTTANKHMKEGRLSVPRECMRQLVREIVQDFALKFTREGKKMDREAVDALHTAVEAYAIDLFTTAGQLGKLAERSTVHLNHFHAACSVHKQIAQAAAVAWSH